MMISGDLLSSNFPPSLDGEGGWGEGGWPGSQVTSPHEKKTYVQKITLLQSLQVLENLSFWYIYTKQSDTSLLPFSFWKKQTCYFRVSQHQPSKLASNGNHSPWWEHPPLTPLFPRLHVPTSRFLPRNCQRKTVETEMGPHLWKGFFVDYPIGIFGASFKNTKL